MTISEEQAFAATQWKRHGDHPKVRVASTSDLPWATDAARYGWLDVPNAGQAVLPGDWIVQIGSTFSVVNERDFRKKYEPMRRVTTTAQE